MAEIDLMSIGSYTELPGGNIALPQGYSSLLLPIINVSPPHTDTNDEDDDARPMFRTSQQRTY